MEEGPPAVEGVQEANPVLQSGPPRCDLARASQVFEADPSLQSEAAGPAREAGPGRLSETLLPSSGTTLLVLQRYPDGVLALWDDSGGRVLFLRLQEIFALTWRPELDPRQEETS